MASMQPLVFGIIALAAAVIIMAVFMIILMKRITRLAAGASAKSLESIIIENNIFVKNLKAEHLKMEGQILALENDSLLNIQNIGVVRFNPFKEMGGSQSFAVAFTDKNNTGIVLSSIFTRDRVNIFAKPVIKGDSEYTLTKEEKEALTRSQI